MSSPTHDDPANADLSMLWKSNQGEHDKRMREQAKVFSDLKYRVL